MTASSIEVITTNQVEQVRPTRMRAGDLTYLLGSVLLEGMARPPASWQVAIIDHLSGVLARTLHALDALPARNLRQNIAVVLPASAGRAAIIRRLLQVSIWNSLTLNSLPYYSTAQIANLVTLEGETHLTAGRDAGVPALIWAFHFGVHPLIVAATLQARGYPIHAVTHILHMPATASTIRQRYLRQLAPLAKRLSVIDPRDALGRKMLDVLQNAACLFVTPDYMLPPSERSNNRFSVRIPLLGRSAFLETGSLRLAKRLGAQVITVLSQWEENRKPRLIIRPLTVTAELNPNALRRDLQAGMARLETAVQAAPGLWWDLKRADFLERLIVTEDGV